MAQHLELECICGKTLTPIKASTLMENYNILIAVTCTYCTDVYEGDHVMYACQDLTEQKCHPNGYGFCGQCAQIINDEESKQGCNKPKSEQLLFQRILNSMLLAQTNAHLLNKNENNHRFVLQNLRTLCRIEGMCDYKILKEGLNEEQKKQMNTKLETLVFSLLDIEQQYDQIQKTLHTKGKNDQQLLKLRQFVAFLTYSILRMKDTVKKLNNYYDKFKQLQKDIDNQIIDKSKDRYCICGRLLLEMFLTDTEFSRYNCAVCNRLFERINSTKVIQCQLMANSIFHKEYAFSVCVECSKHNMKQCIKRDFITDEVCISTKDKKKETDEEKNDEKKKIVFEEYNKNIMLFVLFRYDKMDIMLSKIKSINEEKEYENVSPTEKWQLLGDTYYSTTQVVSSLTDYLIESDKIILAKRKNAIYDVMKCNMPLCYCGNIFTTIKSHNTVHCTLCLKQYVKVIINEFLIGK
eukprot:89379_1